jgi:hypothetical protein
LNLELGTLNREAHSARQPLERSIPFHLFEKASIDQLLRRDFGRARVGFGNFLQRRLNRFRPDFQTRL